ncbi:MAG: aspartyl protease family protein, partial [Candidatus Heimdallarchaeota archaeon]|nr:aspartyl protease family protein [Candidatus Heimdallarchaeota archaeon]
MNHKDESGLEKAFYQGQIEETRIILLKKIKNDPDNALLNRLLGQYALLKNHFDEAEEYLQKAYELDSKDKKTLEQLAQLYYRQDQYGESANFYQKLDKPILAKKLLLLKDRQVYQLIGDKNETEIKLDQVDPLPLLKVEVNGKEATFFIDTGAWENIIDNDFASEIGIEDVGSSQGIFAGGKQAPVGHGICDKFSIGDFTIMNIPVALLPTRRMSPIFGGKVVSGILGTNFFYHFITTLDYVNGRLILRTRNNENYNALEKQILERKPHDIPFWLSRTHFILAWGKIEDS